MRNLALLIAFASAPAAAQDVSILPFEIEISEGSILAYGRWLPAEDYIGLNRMTVFNAAQVECYRDLMVCFESVASLTSEADSLRRPGHLMSLGLRYKVERWSDNEIVAVAQTRATNVQLNIDPIGSVVVRTLRETNERGASGADLSQVERWILR